MRILGLKLSGYEQKMNHYIFVNVRTVVVIDLFVEKLRQQCLVLTTFSVSVLYHSDFFTFPLRSTAYKKHQMKLSLKGCIINISSTHWIFYFGWATVSNLLMKRVSIHLMIYLSFQFNKKCCLIKDLHRTGCSLFCGDDAIPNQVYKLILII